MKLPTLAPLPHPALAPATQRQLEPPPAPSDSLSHPTMAAKVRLLVLLRPTVVAVRI